jgi:hypothetical protein
MKKGKVDNSVEKKTQKNANLTLYQRVYFASTQAEWFFDARILPGLKLTQKKILLSVFISFT